MIDVDAFTRRYGPLIATHCAIAGILHDRDIKQRPDAYERTIFLSSQSSKLSPSSIQPTTIPVLLSIFITTAYCPSENSKVSNKPVHIILISQILFFDANHTINKPSEVASNGTEMRITTLAKELCSEWICIDDVIGSS